MLTKQRGYICLAGPVIDDMAACSIPVPRQRHPFHVTLFSKAEVREHDLQLPEEDVAVTDLIDAGLGRCRGIFFKVILWPRGDALRREHDLPRKDFHITLSLANPQSSSTANERGVDYLLSHPPADGVFKACTDAAFDRIYSGYMARGMEREASLATARYMKTHPLRAAGFVRYADSLFAAAQLSKGQGMKHAMLAYAHAASLSAVESRTLDYCVARICRCAQYTEFGPLFTEDEFAHMQDTLDMLTMLAPWTANVQAAVAAKYAQHRIMYGTDLCSIPPRERLSVRLASDGVFYTLPRFFRWLVPFRVAIMSTPRHHADVKTLSQALHIGLIVTLTKEGPLDANWFDDEETENLLVPVDNYRAPTLSQTDHIMSCADKMLKKGRAVLVHCGGGKGRAGTVAACWLAQYGFSTERQEVLPYTAAEAIRLVRALRPGSIETEEQEQFVADYVRHLWKRLSRPPPHDNITGGGDDDEGGAGPDHLLDGHFDGTRTNLIILCGLPGSGKSWFATHFASRYSGRRTVTVVSQDQLGSLGRCEEVVSDAIRDGHLVLVDRCNPVPSDRKLFATKNNPPCQTVCVWLDIEPEVCIQRAELRTDHPTLSVERAERAVRSFAKKFDAPQREEEGLACVARVKTTAGVERLVNVWCKVRQAQPLHKFPRTRHLLNLGAATRDDLILAADDVARFLDTSATTLVMEEKVDGANLGISFDPITMQIRVQNRGHWISASSHKQFCKLDAWLDEHRCDLWTILSESGRILYGEWLYARHSIAYTALPCLFLAFDLYDPNSRQFCSRASLTRALAGSGIHQVRQLELPHGHNRVSEAVLQDLVASPSAYYDGPIEGIYVRKEGGEWLSDRAKIVRNDFLSSANHWSRVGVVRNKLLR